MTTAAICATREFSWSPSYYRGEQYDPDLSLYYLRARYYNPATGRFMSRDPEAGVPTNPRTLHKYLYAGGDPINAIDPMGREEMVETSLAQTIGYAVGTAVRVVMTNALAIAAAVKAYAGTLKTIGSCGAFISGTVATLLKKLPPIAWIPIVFSAFSCLGNIGSML